mgnify:CR=1 FL=1
MRVSPHPAEIRDLVLRMFREFEPDSNDGEEFSENILIDEGRLVARTYRSPGLMAMWMIDVGIVQFYNADGDMLRTVNVFEEWEPHRAAA